MLAQPPHAVGAVSRARKHVKLRSDADRDRRLQKIRRVTARDKPWWHHERGERPRNNNVTTGTHLQCPDGGMRFHHTMMPLDASSNNAERHAMTIHGPHDSPLGGDERDPFRIRHLDVDEEEDPFELDHMNVNGDIQAPGEMRANTPTCTSTSGIPPLGRPISVTQPDVASSLEHHDLLQGHFGSVPAVARTEPRVGNGVYKGNDGHELNQFKDNHNQEADSTHFDESMTEQPPIRYLRGQTQENGKDSYAAGNSCKKGIFF